MTSSVFAQDAPSPPTTPSTSSIQSAAPSEQPPVDQAEPAPPSGDVAQAGEIVVTGIRQSLASAINEKRAAVNVVDVINAQDVGKLPDQNLAEVLENVSGVQVDRSLGVGSNVSIRGSNQNLVLINGRATTPAGDARGGISFDDLPAELIASVRVTKVATADQIEGSVGGIVDLRTYRGLGLRETLAAIRADVEYAENADAFNPKISAAFGKAFETGIGDIGVVLAGTYYEQTVREDSLNVRYASRTNRDLTGDGVADPYLRPNYTQQFFNRSDRTNKSLTGSVEWQTTSNLKLFVDGTYVDQSNISDLRGAFLQQPLDVSELPFASEAVIENRSSSGFDYRQMVSGRIGGTQFRPTGEGPIRETRSYLAAGGGEWDAGDVTVRFEASRAGSDTDEGNFQLVSQYSDPANPNFGNAAGRISPPFLFDVTGDDLYYAIDRTSPLSASISDPAYYQTFIARDNFTRFRNVEDAQRVDAEWRTEFGPLKSIELGARFNQTDSGRTRTTQASRQFPGFSAASRPEFFFRAPDDFFDLTGDPYTGGFVVGRAFVRNPEAIRAATGLPLVPPEDLGSRFRVKEKSYAGYAKLNLDTAIGDVGLRGSAGVRVVHTNQTASGLELNGGVSTPVDVRQKYTYWLPSAILTVEPVASLLVRGSYARSLRRPDFGQLSPSVVFPLLDVFVSAGNPTLRPQTVDQYDAAVEWYFDRNSILSVGGFYKEYRDLVTVVAIPPTLIDPTRGEFDPNNCATGVFNPVSIDFSGRVGECVGINQPQNAGSATLRGVEVNFQHSLTYLPGALGGFGVIANYTYQKGKRDTTFTVPGFVSGSAAVSFELPLRDLSRNNYNVTLFYEKYGINARVRYTFRDPFLRVEATDLTNNLPFYQDERSQLNASVSIDINPQYALTFSGVNLTNEPNIERAIFADGPFAQERIADRRYVFGVRGKF